MKNNFKKTLLASLLSTLSPLVAMANGSFDNVSEMVQLSDNEMSEEVGQALLSMAYTAPSASGTGANTSDFGYYKLGLEAKMELNLNIRSLQLGCGGRNGPGACDIDIENLSLSGPADGFTPSGVDKGMPTWSVGRPNTSALLTNPFVEFAIKNPNTAATREVVGFRLSAEDILGYLSAGTSNVLNPTDGIKSFSGFIKVAQTPVNSSSQQAIFGTRADQAIYGKVDVCVILCGLNDRTVHTNVNKMTIGAPGYQAPPANANIYTYGGTRIWGINVPSQNVSFQFPETTVTGSRMSQLNLVVQNVPVGADIPGDPDTFKRIAIGRDSGGINLTMDQAVAGLVSTATFFMGANNANGLVANCAAVYNSGACSYITNLQANVTVKQNFNLIHNLPISSGGYLSLQKQDVKWPGTDAADIAKPGWWMSFKDPLDFGQLNPTAQIPMDDVLPQIATFITNYLSNNEIQVSTGDALGALFGAPLYKGLGDIVLANNARAVMVLQDLLLDGYQKPVSNCWGGVTFC